MSLDLKVGGNSVSSITQGTALQVDFVSNLNAADLVSLVITDPDGDVIKSWWSNILGGYQIFDRISVGYLIYMYGTGLAPGIDTTDWSLGTYTFKLKTKHFNAHGLWMSSNEKTLTIRKSAITISADKTAVPESKTVRLTVTGVTGHVITIDSSCWGGTIFLGGLDNNPAADTTSTFYDTIDADGKRTYAVEFDDTGAYTITVTDTTTVPQMTDTVDITVIPKSITFDMPSTCAIGTVLVIKGTANTGDWVAIAFDDVIPAGYDKLTIGADGEFSKDISTGLISQSAKLKAPRLVRVTAFINLDVTGMPFPVDVTRLDPEPTDDGTTVVLLVPPSLTAERSNSEISLGDSFMVSGTAEGPRVVEILTVAPEGPSGKGLRATPGITSPWGAPYTGLTYDRTSVSAIDYTFSKKLDVRDTANTGSYLVWVSNPGIDGEYGDNRGPNLPMALQNKYGDISSKTQDQVLAMLNELTTTTCNDDLYWMDYIDVQSGYVELNPIEDVEIGQDLVVTGKTNRADGHPVLVTVKGPVELAPKLAYVDEGEFSATFDTKGIPAGVYTVTADDGDGHTVTTTVNVIKGKITVSITTDKVEYSPGDVIVSSIHLLNPTDDTQNLLFNCYLGIPDHNWTQIMETKVNLPADSDLPFSIPIPVEDWGNKSFCGCYVVSLTNTTTNNVVSVDSASWIYLPSAECKSKTAAEIAKEITKRIEGVELQS